MTRESADRLVAALRNAFDAEVDVEAVNSAGRYRFGIVSPKFEGMPHLDRQDAAWDVVDDTLSRSDVLDVSMILAYAPSDLVTD